MGFAPDTFNLAGERGRVTVCRNCGRGVVGLMCDCAEVRQVALAQEPMFPVLTLNTQKQ